MVGSSGVQHRDVLVVRGWGGIKVVNNLRVVINTPWQVVAIVIVAITMLHALAEVPTLLGYFCH